MRRRCDRSYGLGPLFFHPEGDGAGDPAAGGTPPAPPAPPAAGGAPAPGSPPANGEDRSNWIPRDRFDSVNTELGTLRKEKEEREQADLKAKGDHEKIAETEKAKREAAEARATNIARRSAFIAAAAGKVSDPEAAYKLAVADGLLSDLEVDDDGNAKDSKRPAAIVDEVVKTYEFLKPNKSRDFGGPNGGQSGEPPIDPKNMTGSDMLRAGYAASNTAGRGART